MSFAAAASLRQSRPPPEACQKSGSKTPSATRAGWQEHHTRNFGVNPALEPHPLEQRKNLFFNRQSRASGSL